MTNQIYIGIDPSFRKRGMAICSLEGQDVWFKVFKDYLEFLGWVLNGDAPENAIFCVENSNMQNSTFDMRGNKQEVARKSRNVGKNQAISQLTVDLLKVRFGAKRVISISPRDKGKKLTAIQFQQASGLKIRTNQDQRDAWKLARIARYRSKFLKAA